MGTILSPQAMLDRLRSFGMPAVPIESGVRVETGATTTDVRFEEVDVHTLNGMRIGQIVRVISASDRMASAPDLAFASAINRLATMCCLAIDPTTGSPFVFSKISVNEGEPAADFYLHLIALTVDLVRITADVLARDSRAQIVRWLDSGDTVTDLPRRDERPTFSAEDWQAGWDWIKRNNLFGTYDVSGLTVEFPWDRGAVSSMAGVMGYPGHKDKKTSLLTIKTSERNPFFGQGLLAVLRLPLALPPERSDLVVNELNLWEYQFADLPPSIGAWTLDTDVFPAYCCFFPTCRAMTPLPRHLIWWMGGRAWRAQRWLADRLQQS
jgi:hypothetical protein